MRPDRKELGKVLAAIDGVRKVYFQAPSTVVMEYPCIRYERSSSKTIFADGNPYSTRKRYSITVIDKNPDSTIPDAVEKLPLCSFESFGTAEGLNQWNFTIYI